MDTEPYDTIPKICHDPEGFIQYMVADIVVGLEKRLAAEAAMDNVDND